MRIKSLYLNNVGNFDDFEIEFTPNRNAFFGLNGIGKTTILDSIASFFYLDTKKNKPLFFRKDFKSKKSDFKLSIEYNLPIEKNIKSIINFTNKDENYKVNLKKFNKNTDNKVIYFTANRFFSANHSTLKANIKKDEWVLQVYDLEATSFNSKNKIHEYIISNEAKGAFNLLYKSTNKVVSLKELINSILTDKEFIRIDIINDEYEVIFKNSDNKEFTLFDLSHGEKLLLMFVIEFHKNRWNNSIILIDEPEIGLHPAWQIDLIPILEKLGKNNQFIVATHSEEMVYIFEEDEVFYLGN